MAHLGKTRRGFTVTELALAGGLGLLVLVGVTLVARPTFAHSSDNELEQRSRVFLEGAQSWRDSHPEGCPTVSQLIADGALDPSVERSDPWGGQLRLVCDEAQFRVLSPGEDGNLGSSDDLSYPTR